MLTDDPRYQRTLDEYGERARRQLVCGLHLHVSLGGADRTLAVYNALRSHLPELAALAANAPFHAGRDTGLASIRPTIAVQPAAPGRAARHPELGVVRAGAAAGAQASDTVPDARRWWFELRLHATYGTLELRAPDAQSSASTTCTAWPRSPTGSMHALAARFDAGEPLPVHDSWRIDENRWAAMRDGVEGTLADLDDRRARADPRAAALTAPRRCTRRPSALIEANGAIRTRAGRAGRRRRVPRAISGACRDANQSFTRRQASSAACGLKRAGVGVVEERVLGLGEGEDLVVHAGGLERRARPPRGWRSRGRRAPA